MKCPYCSVTINLTVDHSCEWHDDEEVVGTGTRVECGHCPACEKLIINLIFGDFETDHFDSYFVAKSSQVIFVAKSSQVIFPKLSTRLVESEVPERYKKDFLESCAILPFSSKAIAALSRRILQDVFHNELGIKKRTLEHEIEEFVNRGDVPSYLCQAVDAVRNIGNFAAHPLKSTNTGEIVEVEPGEAEWLLEVNESLFDFVFVQPKRLADRRDSLNSKLGTIGKPELKG